MFIHLGVDVVVTDCKWGPYSEWSSCSKTCGGGVQSRNRTIEIEAKNGGKPCTGKDVAHRQCGTITCKCPVGMAGDGTTCGVDSDSDGYPDDDLPCDKKHCKKVNK